MSQNNSELSKSDALRETEEQRSRKETKEEIEDVNMEEDKPKNHIVPFHIKLISFLHLVLVSVLFLFTIFFYNDYVTHKDGDVIDEQTAVRITKTVFCLGFGLLIAFSRAVLLEHYY